MLTEEIIINLFFGGEGEPKPLIQIEIPLIICLIKYSLPFNLLLAIDCKIKKDEFLHPDPVSD